MSLKDFQYWFIVWTVIGQLYNMYFSGVIFAATRGVEVRIASYMDFRFTVNKKSVVYVVIGALLQIPMAYTMGNLSMYIFNTLLNGALTFTGLYAVI